MLIFIAFFVHNIALSSSNKWNLLMRKMSCIRKFSKLSCTVSKFDAYFNDLSAKPDANLKETSYSIEMIKIFLEKRKLNLAPDYQRGFVWKEGRSARLIETILN